MRNAKVRRRIAAGKLRLRIRDLRNLGPRSEELLARIGIRSADGLRRRGAVEAYLGLRRVGATRSLNMLWAMAGALDPWPEGRDWRDVAAGDQRLPLLLAVDEPAHAATDASSARRRRSVGRSGGRVAGERPGTALGDWAPGLPFSEAGSSSPASGRAQAWKAKSRPKAGS